MQTRFVARGRKHLGTAVAQGSSSEVEEFIMAAVAMTMQRGVADHAQQLMAPI
jgi:hypothetical protein